MGVEHQFGKIATMSATYINSRGVHQYLSDNINAYLPATYIRPRARVRAPTASTRTSTSSSPGGVYNQNQLMVNYSVSAKRLTLFGFYMHEFCQRRHLGVGLTSLPTSTTPAPTTAGQLRRAQPLPAGRQSAGALRGFVQPHCWWPDSGTPFNITIGQDLNGDNQFNDRPCLCHREQHRNPMQKKYGNFRSRSGVRTSAHSLQLRQRARVSSA